MGLIGYSKYYLITNLKNCKKYDSPENRVILSPENIYIYYLLKICGERSVRSVGRKGGRPEVGLR
jgi:hypothetical protein